MKGFDFNKIVTKEIDNSIAKEFMKKHHYTKTCAKASISLGFYYNNQLCTVIVYGQPSARDLAPNVWKGGKENQCMELLRLFSFDWCPKNIESHCISKSVKHIKQKYPEIKILISYADTSVGHVGYIYQASNWLYIGKSWSERALYIDGIRRHRRELYDEYGTSSLSKLKELLGDRFEMSKDRYKKNRYIFILGTNKKEHKELMKNLVVEVISTYPKGDLHYYHNEDIQMNF